MFINNQQLTNVEARHGVSLQPPTTNHQPLTLFIILTKFIYLR